jgi:hypothetical protein
VDPLRIASTQSARSSQQTLWPALASLILLVSSSLSHLVFATIPYSMGDGAMGPARGALLRQVVLPVQLLRANSAISFVWQISRIDVPPIVGGLAERGSGRVMIVVGLIFLFIGLMLFARIPRSRSSSAKSRNVAGRAREAWLDRRIRASFAMTAMMWFVTQSLFLLKPLLVRELSLQQGALGAFWAMRGTGGLLVLALMTLGAGRLRG